MSLCFIESVWVCTYMAAVASPALFIASCSVSPRLSPIRHGPLSNGMNAPHPVFAVFTAAQAESQSGKSQVFRVVFFHRGHLVKTSLCLVIFEVSSFHQSFLRNRCWSSGVTELIFFFKTTQRKHRPGRSFISFCERGKKETTKTTTKQHLIARNASETCGHTHTQTHSLTLTHCHPRCSSCVR